MEPQNNFNQLPNSEKWLSLNEAALHTPYSAEYLSLLARKGKLVAKKIDNVWYTTKQIVDDYMRKQMAVARIQNGSVQPTVANLGIGDSNLVVAPTPLKAIRSYHDDHREYLEHGQKKEIINHQTPITNDSSLDIGHSSLVIPALEHALERVIEKKFSSEPRMRRLSFGMPQSLPKSALALAVGSVIFFTVMPVPLVFSFFEKSFDRVASMVSDARTVMGFRPGTHANELLLLDKNGDISIMGHIESHVQDGSAPFVVDSVTLVKNLNADYVNGLHAADFTLAYVTKNGAVTTEDVRLDGNVAVGKTLTVRGLSELGEVKVLGNAEFDKILRVLGPAFFEGVVTMQSDAATKGNFSVSKNATVRGSITAGQSVIGKKGSFANASVDNLFTAAIGKFESLITDDISVDALSASSSVFTTSSIDSLTSASSTLSILTFGNATGTAATTTDLFATVFNAGSITTTGLGTLGDLLVTGSATLQNFTFGSATGTSATTTNFFSTNAHFGMLESDSQTISNLIFTNSTGTAATTTSLFSDKITATNLFFTAGNGTDLALGGTGTFGNLLLTGSSTLQNFTFVNATGTAATTTNFFSTSVSTSGLTSSGLITAANMLVTSSSTLQNFTFVSATGTAATTTDLYVSGLASSTNFRTNTAVVGSATIGAITVGNIGATNSTTTQLAVSSLTSGSIPFVTTGGRIIDNNSQLFWDNSQTYLGLGINTPTEKLQVSGGVGLFNASTIGLGANTTSGLRIVAPIASSNFNWQIGANQNVSNAFEISPSASAGSTSFSTPALTILSGGNVGIGTTQPGTKLDVNGITQATKFIATGSGAIGYQMGSNTGLAYHFDTATGNNFIGETATNQIDLYSGGLLSMTWKSGNVGIGTTTPQYPLSVFSSTGPQLALSAGAGITQWAMRNAGGNLYFATTTVAGTATTSPSALTILGSSGFVGIGTTTPVSELSIEAVAPVISAKSTNNASGLRINTVGTIASGDTIFRAQANGSTKFTVYNNGWIESFAGTFTEGQFGNRITDGTHTGGTNNFTQLWSQRYDGSFTTELDKASVVSAHQNYGSGALHVLFLGKYEDDSTYTVAGSITQSGATTVNYNTSSDERLKLNLGTATSTDVLQDTVIHDFVWKADGTLSRGVFAQEAYNVLPYAVKVGSDEVNSDGTLRSPWAVDYSKYVPDLIVGWQMHESQMASTTVALTSLTEALGTESLMIDQLQADVALLMASASSTTDRLDSVELRIASVESLLSSTTVFAISTTTPGFIASVLEAMQSTIVDGVTHFIELAVDSLSTYALTVGKSDRPAGITVYDEDTHEPFCIKMKSGQQISTPGICGSEYQAQPLPQQQPQPQTPDSGGSSETATSTTEVDVQSPGANTQSDSTVSSTPTITTSSESASETAPITDTASGTTADATTGTTPTDTQADSSTPAPSTPSGPAPSTDAPAPDASSAESAG